MFLVGSLVMFLVSLNHHRDGIITTYGSLDDKRNRATKKYIYTIYTYTYSVLVVVKSLVCMYLRSSMATSVKHVHILRLSSTYIIQYK